MNCPASVPFGASRVLHPHALHAVAALHSTIRAWRNLKAAQIAVARSAACDADRSTIQAWKPGSGVSGGTGVGSGLDAAVCETPSVQAASRAFDLQDLRVRCGRHTLCDESAHRIPSKGVGGMSVYEPEQGFREALTILDIGEAGLIVTPSAEAAQWAEDNGYLSTQHEFEGNTIYEIRPGEVST